MGTCSSKTQTQTQTQNQPIEATIITPYAQQFEKVESTEIIEIDYMEPKNLGKNIIYFDGNAWSKGQIYEIGINNVTIIDIFTQATHTFKSNSVALRENIHPCSLMREHKTKCMRHLQLSGPLAQIVLSNSCSINHGPNDKASPKLNLRDNLPSYSINDSSSIMHKEMVPGKKIKLYFSTPYWKDDKKESIVIRHLYVYGYIYSVGKYHVTITIKIYQNQRYINLVIPEERYDMIYEREKGDSDIKMFTPVKYKDSETIIVDVAGDMVKLSGINTYVNKSEVKINLCQDTLDEMLKHNPKIFNIGDNLIQ